MPIRCCGCFFFFSSRRRHTRSDRDWSSDVCSSDLVGVVPGVRGEVEVREGPVGSALHLLLPHAKRSRSKAHVLADGAREELLVRVLEYRPDPPRQLLRDAVTGIPVADPHRSLARSLEPRDEADHGGLAGAVLAQQRDALPRGDGERQAVQHRYGAVGESHAVEAQGRNHRQRRTAWATVRGYGPGSPLAPQTVATLVPSPASQAATSASSSGVPTARTVPSSSHTTRSATSGRASRALVASRTAFPSFASTRISRHSALAPSASSSAAGSSNSTRPESMARVAAMITRCSSPPDRVAGSRVASGPSSSCSRTRST